MMLVLQRELFGWPFHKPLCATWGSQYIAAQRVIRQVCQSLLDRSKAAADAPDAHDSPGATAARQAHGSPTSVLNGTDAQAGVHLLPPPVAHSHFLVYLCRKQITVPWLRRGSEVLVHVTCCDVQWVGTKVCCMHRADRPAKRSGIAAGGFMKFMSGQKHLSGQQVSDVEAMAQVCMCLLVRVRVDAKP